MRTLSQRIIRTSVEVPTRSTKELQREGDPSEIHFCLEQSDGTLLLIERGMPVFAPPADDSTIVAIRVKPKAR